MKTVLNCIAGKPHKTRTDNFIIPLVDIVGTEYGRVILEDDFGQDLAKTEFVRFIEAEAKKSE